MSDNSVVGVSAELVEHHLRVHREVCRGEHPHDDRRVDCPCGDCAVVLCGSCHGVLALAMNANRAACEHAVQVMDRYGERR